MPFNAQSVLNELKNTGDFPAFTINNKKHEKVGGVRVQPVVGFQDVHSVEIFRMIGSRKNVIETITAQNIRSFFSFFGPGFMYAPSMYRNVKTSPDWINYYVYPNEPFVAVSKTDVRATNHEDGAVCQGCRTMFPLRTVSIDHQKPKVGGRTLAVARVFRGLGLTIGTPKLTGKNSVPFTNRAALVGGDATPNTGANTVSDRYSLNSAGEIYYSIFHKLDLIDPELKDACMHHYINLRPMCGPCNSSLSNTNAF